MSDLKSLGYNTVGTLDKYVFVTLRKQGQWMYVYLFNARTTIFCRHALIFPHAHILFCTIILEFGKKGDLASALTVFEASKENLSCPNMYIYRTIIDACGLCGDYLKSRSIYEVFGKTIIVVIICNFYMTCLCMFHMFTQRSCALVYTQLIYYLSLPDLVVNCSTQLSLPGVVVYFFLIYFEVGF